MDVSRWREPHRELDRVNMLKAAIIKILNPYIRQLLDEELTPRVKQIVLREYLVHGDPSRLLISKNVVMNNAVFNLASGCIKLEENVFFGHNVSLLTGTHDVSKRGLARQTAVPRNGRDIIVKQGAWVASNTTIIGPCTIGENAVIGAGSLVVGNVLPNYFYAGVPAKPIKALTFDEE
jgi:acetyltransferase-like isoleucine patch superfamily enzyme